MSELVTGLLDAAAVDTIDGGVAVKQRGPHQRFAVPDGWVPRAFKFEVEWPDDQSLVRQHFGARRFAYNWALARVKADMDARKADPGHGSIPWNLYALRKQWNIDKHIVAPWWAQASKEAYSSGIADCVTALTNWRSAKAGTRRGAMVRFPRFKSRRTDRARVRFTTGTMRCDPDRRTIVLPCVGELRSKQNTRRLERLLTTGRARILNVTMTERWGRLFVSFACVVQHQRPAVTHPDVTAGVDLGLRVLATIATSSGEIIEIPNPAPLRATLTERRRVGRSMSRRIPGSRGHQRAKAKLAALDRRCVNLRQHASHQLTTKLAATYGQIVVEDLDLAAMKRGMGRRAFRRSVSDAAVGQIRPQLVYKTNWYGSTLTVADRWYASSKTHHLCGCRLIEPRRLAKHLVCAVTGEPVDRDHNAALNLRDWPDHASCSSVGAAAPNAHQSASARTTTPGGRGRTRKTNTTPGVAKSREARTEPTEPSVGAGTPRRGAAA
jgi:putative transposase